MGEACPFCCDEILDNERNSLAGEVGMPLEVLGLPGDHGSAANIPHSSYLPLRLLASLLFLFFCSALFCSILACASLSTLDITKRLLMRTIFRRATSRAAVV